MQINPPIRQWHVCGKGTFRHCPLILRSGITIAPAPTPDLKRTVDILIDNGQEFTPSVSANLFERFFTHDAEDKSVQSATTKLEGVIKRASEYLNEAGEGAAQFGEQLADATGALENAAQDNQARDIIEGIIGAS